MQMRTDYIKLENGRVDYDITCVAAFILTEKHKNWKRREEGLEGSTMQLAPGIWNKQISTWSDSALSN